MFGLFRRPAANNDIPRQLIFKSNVAAYQYACEYGNNDLRGEQPVVSIVLEANSDNTVVKVANRNDNTIPSEEPRSLLDQGLIDHICFTASKLVEVPILSRGDLVLYVAPAEFLNFRRGVMMGLVVAKILPVFDAQTGAWRLATA